MGDGHKSKTFGVCHEIKIEINWDFIIDAYLFGQEDIDMILGMSWLVSLRPRESVDSINH